MVVRYRDRVLRKDLVEDSLSFIRAGGDDQAPTYKISLYLRTPAARYRVELPIFEWLLDSVRFVPPDY